MTDKTKVVLSAVREHAALPFRRQYLHDHDIYQLSAALGPVEEPTAAKNNHNPGFKAIIYIGPTSIASTERSPDEI